MKSNFQFAVAGGKSGDGKDLYICKAQVELITGGENILQGKFS